MVEQPSETFTFLFTDIEGSTTLWDQSPEAMEVALARHDDLLRNTIEEQGGQVIKSLGDGVAAVFDDPVEAVAAAVIAQRALHAEVWTQIGPLRVRIALQTGPAHPRDGDYYGQTVNRVARLVAIAQAGQIVLSEATAAVVGPYLPMDVRLHNLGERHLRGMSRPENVFQVILIDLSTESRPTDSTASPAGTTIRHVPEPQLAPPALWRPSAAPSTPPVLEVPFIPSYPFPVPERLIGRQPQMDALASILERGRTSRQLVLVSAPAGTGKSALVGALAQRARHDGVLCLVGGGYEEEGVVPLGPFREALADYLLTRPAARVKAEFGSVIDDLTLVIPELRQHLSLTDRPLPAASPDRDQLFGAIHACLRMLSSRQPVLLCIEDLHAVGTATLALIQFLARQMRRQPIVILGTFRTEELQPGRPLADLVTAHRQEGVERLDLQPLSQEQTTSLVAALLDGEPSDQLSASLYQSTEGNPLFVEQLLLALREDGRLDRRGATWHQRGARIGSIPRIVRDVIGRRLQRLSDRGRDTLALAAVLGQTLDHRALLAASDSDDEVALLEDLDEAFRAHILQETPNGWTFAHALLREVVYTGLSAPRRMLLHARVGEVLEQLAGSKADEQAAELAHHFSLGGQSKMVRDKALRYSMEAGRRASALSAYRESLDHFNQACTLIRGAREQVDLAVHLDALEGCGRAARWVGAWLTCTERLFEFLELSDDPLRRARARNDIGHAFSATGRTAEALMECNAGLAELSSTADEPEALGVRLRLEYDLALLHFLEGRFRSLRALAQEMLGIATQFSEPMHLEMAHSVMAWTHMALDEVDQALEQYLLALDAAERWGNKSQIAVAHVNLGIQNYRGGRFAAARPELEHAIALFRAAAGDVRAINGIQTLGRVWLAEGDLPRAEAQAQLVETIIANGEHRWEAECHDLRGTIQTTCAQWELAEASFSQAIRIRGQVGHRAGLIESLLGLGLVYERRGDWSRAIDTYGQALELARAMDPSPQGMAAERQCGRLLLRRGHDAEGGKHIRAACMLGEKMPQSIEFAPTLLAAAELALPHAPGDAAKLAERALTMGGTVEVRIDAHALAVSAYVRVGQHEAAGKHANSAHDLATRMNTPYLLGLALLARARLEAAIGSQTAEGAAEAALQHFVAARTPYERAMAILVYATLPYVGHQEDGRTEKLRLEADRLVNALRG